MVGNLHTIKAHRVTVRTRGDTQDEHHCDNVIDLNKAAGRDGKFTRCPDVPERADVPPVTCTRVRDEGDEDSDELYDYWFD